MTTEGILPFSLSSIVEDVLKQTAVRSAEKDFVARKAKDPSFRRYEAAEWLRRIVGTIGGKDLPDEPSEEEFRIALRSGIILCNALNRVQPGSVSKVVEGPYDSEAGSDGAALCAFQFFENVRNFLLAIEEIGLPTFEASDLEQGGKSSRLVDCVLALKSYSDWKLSGCHGSWKYSGNLKSTSTIKQFVRKNCEAYMSMSHPFSLNEKSIDGCSMTEQLTGSDNGEMSNTASLSTLIRANLLEKRKDEIPAIVESMLCKVMEEFERRYASQCEMMKIVSQKDAEASDENNSPAAEFTDEQNIPHQMEDEDQFQVEVPESISNNELSVNFKQQKIFIERQQIHVQELRSTLLSTKDGLHFLRNKYQEDFDILGKHVHSLAHAASGYQRVLEENRKLYNQVQDLKGSFHFLQSHTFNATLHFFCNTRFLLLLLLLPETLFFYISLLKTRTHSFLFFLILQRRSFRTCGRWSDLSLMDIYQVSLHIVSVFSSMFHQTGPRELTEETLGVNYRALGDLFVLSKEREEVFSYEVSDANVVPVSSTQDVISLMNLGQKNRAVSATSLNERSSRSHSCVTVHVQGRNLTSGASLRGCMHLVDLAGSERVDKSEVVGDRLKEAQHINKSLSALGDVISSLAHKNSHVPYRNSKLTQLLQDSLGGQAKTLMFVHISPELEAVGETLSTLKFAERVSTIELGAAKVNKDNSEVKELKEQIANLKAALARKDGESEHTHSLSNSPDSYDRTLGNSLSPLSRQNSEDLSSTQAASNSLLSDMKQGNDLQNSSSQPWQADATSGLISLKDDDNYLISADWEDKVMVNKLDDQGKDENILGFWEEDNRQLSGTLYRRYTLDPSKIYPEQRLGRFSGNKKGFQEYGIPRSRSETASIVDSDDLETATATSDCSEPELISSSQLIAPRVGSNGLGSKTKKSSLLKPTRSGEIRSMIPSLIPSPSRKLHNGTTPQAQRTVRSADGKRKTGLAK